MKEQNCDPLKPYTVVQFMEQEILSFNEEGPVFTAPESNTKESDSDAPEEDDAPTELPFIFQEFISCDAAVLQKTIERVLENKEKFQALPRYGT